MIETRANRSIALGSSTIGHEPDPQPSMVSPTKRKRSSSKAATAKTDPVLSMPLPSKKLVSKNTPTFLSLGRQVLLAHDVAAIATDQPYIDLNIPSHELRPSATLTTGQCFHWRVVEQSSNSNTLVSPSAWGRHDAIEWVGVLRLTNGESLVVSIKETPHTTLYRALDGTKGVEEILHDYFQLHHKLGPLYSQWSKDDPTRLAKIAKCIPGVRIIEQDPWECLISFICSSNNNIPRITKMVHSIRRKYGKALMTIGDETLHSFPSLIELKKMATDDDLRKVCGLGYRSKYILDTMETLTLLGGEKYLHDLRHTNDPEQVQAKLTHFCGVGRKVADCVALFSLRQFDAIPVDTHVWNIARRDYDKNNSLLDAKSMTPSVYKQTGDLFRNLFQSKAGWAHSLLFVAELPSFRPVLPREIIDEMEKVSVPVLVVLLMNMRRNATLGGMFILTIFTHLVPRGGATEESGGERRKKAESYSFKVIITTKGPSLLHLGV